MKKLYFLIESVTYVVTWWEQSDVSRLIKSFRPCAFLESSVMAWVLLLFGKLRKQKYRIFSVIIFLQSF